MNRLENSSITATASAVCLFVAMLFGATQSFAQMESIDCEDSAIQSTLETLLPPRSDDCQRTKSRSRYNLEWHYRFFVMPDGFAPVVHVHAIAPTTLIQKPIKGNIIESFTGLESDAENWRDEDWVSAGNEKFRVISFDLPEQKGCVGFQSYRLVQREGFKDMIIGFFCNRWGTPVPGGDLSEFLGSLTLKGR